jgi:squalene-hopene/tetraprenyl-beta-curcumene cyclase
MQRNVSSGAFSVKRFLQPAACFGALLIGGVLLAGAQAEDVNTPGVDAEKYEKAVSKAVQYFETAQGEDGSFSSQAGIGPTALATLAILRTGRSVDTPVAAKALDYLETFVRSDGGIYPQGSRLANYETCIGLMVFQEANKDGRYDKIVNRAEAFIRKGQWGASGKKDKSDVYYGGAGYAGSSRPDLSNTSFLVDSLKSMGADSNDAALQRALVFVSRCQNLETEHNTTPFAAKVNDGGFYYTCAIDQQDATRENPDGALRSYGAMTYSGLKSMIYAGVSEDDPRVKAAVTWIAKNYSLQSNPGMGDAGLYYYYHTFSKALDALGAETIDDADGRRHNWRAELVDELASRQQENGSWVNSNRRWLESDPNLATAFALLSLTYCKPE